MICWSLHIVLQKYGREKIKRERKKIVLPLEIENTEGSFDFTGDDGIGKYIVVVILQTVSC